MGERTSERFPFTRYCDQINTIMREPSRLSIYHHSTIFVDYDENYDENGDDNDNDNDDDDDDDDDEEDDDDVEDDDYLQRI